MHAVISKACLRSDYICMHKMPCTEMHVPDDKLDRRSKAHTQSFVKHKEAKHDLLRRTGGPQPYYPITTYCMAL